MEKAQIILHIHHPVTYTLYDAKWIPRSAKLVVLGNHPKGTGALNIYEMDHGKLNVVKEVCRIKPIVYLIFLIKKIRVYIKKIVFLIIKSSLNMFLFNNFFTNLFETIFVTSKTIL